VAGLLRRLDAFQQRRRWAGFGYAVVRKYGEDRAGHDAALLAYYAFLSVFPLLLVAVSVLGIALRNNPGLQSRVLASGLASFPVIGDQLRTDIHSLDRSGLALVLGLAATFVGARGLADAAQSAFNDLWQVPYASRPGFPRNLLRSFAILVVLAVGSAVTGFTAAALSHGSTALWERLLAAAGGLVVSAALFVLGFRLATAPVVRTRQLVLGAMVATVAWQVLLAVGGVVVAHYVNGAGQVYGTFATVIGMLAWFALQAQVTLYAVEIDVVRSRRLWPRSLHGPPLTAADRMALGPAEWPGAPVARQDQPAGPGPGAGPPGGTDPPRRARSRAAAVLTAAAAAAVGLVLARRRGGKGRQG
jgi:membrane protein